jgi:8-oxo-dGTP pyrophosphatase MutT (NUDIX family)
MVITIKEDGMRFGVRVVGIIFNNDMTKVFMQRQCDHNFYMFPGGRLEIHEEAEVAIKRELKEELGIEEEVQLKYIAESFIKFPNLHYHEIGFYFITRIDENKYGFNDMEEYDSLDDKNDGKSKFRWIEIERLCDFEITPSFIKEKIIGNEIKFDKMINHLVYREY